MAISEASYTLLVALQHFVDTKDIDLAPVLILVLKFPLLSCS